MIAKLVLDAKATLAEGPVWCPRRNKLIWVDILEKQIHFFDPISSCDELIQLEFMIGAACPVADSDDLMIATERGIGVLSSATCQIDWLGDPEWDKPDNRFNDGRFDPAGRFWAGTMRIDCADTQEGALYRVSTDGHIEKVLDEISLSNGLDWFEDKMFYVDTPTNRVDVFDYDNLSGEIKNRRPLIELSQDDGVPDGLTVDALGNIWLAQWGAGLVGKYSSLNGDLLGEVPIPAVNVTSIAIDADSVFYVTSAKSCTSEKNDQGGSIFAFVP